MQHCFVDFLCARDLAALSLTCAHMHNALEQAWHPLQLARFPHKKHALRSDHVKCNSREFLLGLEARVVCAPPHGMAWTFRASHNIPANARTVPCTTGCGELKKLYVADWQLMIRGDIIIDEIATMYVFDGHDGRIVDYDTYKGQIDGADLSPVFTIPYEFHILYYGYMRKLGVTIKGKISAKVALTRKDNKHAEFTYCGEQYIIENYDDEDPSTFAGDLFGLKSIAQSGTYELVPIIKEL